MTTAVTKTNSRMVQRAPDPATPQVYFDAGGTTFHVHTCPDKDGHTWACNSPYCENLNRLCPDHGGTEPVVKGEEPWRGR